MKPTCDRLWEVDALRDGRLSPADVDAFARHRKACALCTERFAADERGGRLAQALPTGESAVDDLAARRLRGRILGAAAAPAPSAMRRRTAAIVALAVCLALAWVAATALRRSPTAPAPVAVTPAPSSAVALLTMASDVVASDDARWARHTEGTLERVRIDAGVVALHVRHLTQEERFFVDLPDGEIEVRGTRFEVTVEGGATERVRVTEGVIAFRPVGAPEQVLRAGDTWARPRADASARRGPHAVRDVAPPTSGAPVADEYAEGIALYRAHRDADAAARFRHFALTQPARPEAEDALFLEALALNRVGETDEAARAALVFTSLFPRSIHTHDAAVLAAKGLARDHQCERARAVLEVVAPPVDERAARAALGACAPAGERLRTGDGAP